MSGPSPDGSLAPLARYDSPTLSNAIEAFAVRGLDEGFCGPPVSRVVGAAKPMVGRAVTATMGSSAPSSDAAVRAALYERIGRAGGPVVVVIQDLDERPGHGAFLGELQATLFSRLGAVGIATDGAVRDLDRLRDIGFQAFAGCVSVSHAYAHLLEVDVPVEIGGLRIAPGDVLHGDEHGLLSVPVTLVERLPAVAEAVIGAEQAVLDWAGSPAFDRGEILERLAAVKAAALEAVGSRQ